MERLFTVPRSDLRMEFFRAGGKGGQKQNKTSSACRITHLPSGAVGESRDERQQTHNRRLALERLVARKEFLAWVRIETARLSGATEVVEGDCRIEFAATKCVPGEAYCDVERR